MMNKYELKEKRLKILYRVLPCLSIIMLIILWFACSGDGPFDFPSPVRVFERFVKFLEKPIMKLSLWQHIGMSLFRVLVGLLVSWILGIALGVALGWNKKINALIGPLFNAFRAVPPLAWVPLITIWFGIGEFPKILVIFIGALMPVVVNTQAGISNVNKAFLDVGEVFNANSRQLLFSIAIPASLDAIFAGIRTSASTGWMVVLAAEMLGGKSGVGFLIVRGMDAGDLPLVLLSMICIALVGMLIAVVTEQVERMVCPWTRVKK